MNNKHNPYLRLFTRDIEGSPKINALSMAASGLYFRLLNRFNEPPMPGSLALHEWEVHYNWKRSLTQQCLATADKRERLQYFAKYLSRIFQWKSADILKSLQELYFFGIVVIEDDRLIQPRMYRDNGYRLRDAGTSEADIDLATGALKNTTEKEVKHSDSNASENKKKNGQENKEKKSQKNKSKKTSKKAPSPARVHALSVESENNNIVNGDNKVINKRKTENKTSKKNNAVADNPPTLEDIQAYFDERSAQGKPFLYVTPEGFFDACAQSGWRLKDGKPMMDWRARVRTFENYRRDRGDAPVSVRPKVKAGESVPATPPKEGKFRKW